VFLPRDGLIFRQAMASISCSTRRH